MDAGFVVEVFGEEADEHRAELMARDAAARTVGMWWRGLQNKAEFLRLKRAMIAAVGHRFCPVPLTRPLFVLCSSLGTAMCNQHRIPMVVREEDMSATTCFHPYR